ncbi:MAG: hypothetical protein JW843_08965 [Candidatus Aminicenantes bacterium]|nr:hypothetical protein [Candidatus Aminicenantes bacterium]
MNLQDDKIRNILRGRSSPGSCPSSEILAAAMLGKIKRPLRDELIDHLLVCEECAREVRLLADLDSRLDLLLTRKASERAKARGFRLPRLRPVWASALLLIPAAAAAWFFLLRSGSLPEGDTLRGEDASAVVFLAPGNTLPPVPAPAEFRWSPVPGAALYSFEILTAELDILFSAGSEPGITRTLPLEIRGRLIKEEFYFAKVKALDSSGKTVAEGMLKFRPE